MSSNNSSTVPISKSELEQCQELVSNFRVNELHLLLSAYQFPKLGKKQELVSKALSILSNPKYQLSAVQKIREIQAHNRVRNAAQPYTTGSSVHSNQQNTSNMQPHRTNNAMAPPLHSFIQPNHVRFPGHIPGLQQFGAYGGNDWRHNPQNYTQYPGPSGSLLASSYQHHGHGQSSSSAVPLQQVDNPRDLKIVTLPFYDHVKVVHPITALPAYNAPLRPGDAKFFSDFSIPQENIGQLYYRSDDKPLPRFEIQLRVFLLDTTGEQQDAFPPNTVVKVDDYNVQLPSVIPTNRPNAEQKRLSRPVNLTPYCQPPRGNHRPHRIYFEWAGDKRAWAFGIFIVNRVNSNILLDRIMKEPSRVRPFEYTRNIVISRLGDGDDDGIKMDTLKVSLLDPLMRTRINIPSRPVDCTHLQCFDLNNYLMMSEKRPVWKCPVCDNPALYSKLIIDGYYQSMLKDVAMNEDEVELLRDGTWRVCKEEVLDLSGDDDDVMVVMPSTKSTKKEQASTNSSSEPPPPSQIQKQPPPKTTSQGTGASSTSDAKKADAVIHSNEANDPLSDSDDSIIVLDSDSDEGYHPPPPPQRMNRGINEISSREHSNSSSTLAGGREQTPTMNGFPLSNTTSATNTYSNSSTPSNNTNLAREASSTLNTYLMNNQTGNQTNASSPLLPVLQTNGCHPQLFRPIIDCIAKNEVAQRLASFLQHVYSKNECFFSE